MKCIPTDGILRALLVEASVRRQTTIGQELLWLLAFLAIFAAVAALGLAYASSHHYNDRIAISLAGIFAAVLTIALRAKLLGTNARRS